LIYPDNTTTVIKYIDECCTLIYQPCGVIVNKVLKQKIRATYFNHLLTTSSHPGEQVKVSREILVKFIEDAYSQINDDQIRNNCISQGFGKCGLNSFAMDMDAFESPLDGLDKNKVYNLLQ